MPFSAFYVAFCFFWLRLWLLLITVIILSLLFSLNKPSFSRWVCVCVLLRTCIDRFVGAYLRASSFSLSLSVCAMCFSFSISTISTVNRLLNLSLIMIKNREKKVSKLFVIAISSFPMCLPFWFSFMFDLYADTYSNTLQTRTLSYCQPLNPIFESRSVSVCLFTACTSDSFSCFISFLFFWIFLGCSM